MTKHQGVLAERLLALPRRIEPLSGQQTSYVQLDSVIALVEQFDVSAALAAVQQEERERCAKLIELNPNLFRAELIQIIRDRPLREAQSAPKAPRPEATRSASSQLDHEWRWDEIANFYRCNRCLVLGNRDHGPTCPGAPGGLVDHLQGSDRESQ